MGRRRIALCAVLALATAAIAAGPAQSRGHTAASVYEAFSYHGVIVPRVSVASGYCYTSSDVTPRDDAWRCFVGNDLYDPCFSSTLAFGVVVCAIPWSDTGTEIRLTKALPSRGSHTPPSLALQPWAVETAAGAYCLLSSGASNVVHGKRLNYFCRKNVNYGLWGFPSRSSQPWTIIQAPFTAKVLEHRVAIVRAWM